MSKRGGITGYSYGRRLFDRGKDFDVLRSGYFIYDLILEFVYCSELLFEYLCAFLLGINGDNRNASMLGGEVTQLGNAHIGKLRLQLIRES
ncbi:hypothetical protein MKW98_005089, partial [Papaver atlanticum]